MGGSFHYIDQGRCRKAPTEFRSASSTLRNIVPPGAAHEAAAGHALSEPSGNYIAVFNNGFSDQRTPVPAPSRCHSERPFVILSVSEGSGDGSRRRAPEWYSRSFTPPTASFRMTVLFRLKMTVSFQLRMTYGPRTSKICIQLIFNDLQKSIVRGPHFFEGTTNKEISYCVVSQRITKKLMFAVRCRCKAPIRPRQPS